MSKEFDTSWFDLKNYDKLNELDLYGWVEQIGIRQGTFDDIEVRKHILNDIGTYLEKITIVKGELNLNEEEFEELLEEDEEFHEILNGLEEFDLTSISKRIKHNPMVTRWPRGKYETGRYPFSCDTISVYGTSAAEHWHIANDDKLSDIWELLKPGWFMNEITHEQAKLIHSPIDIIYKTKDISCRYDTSTHVTIELAASDEQIMSDFRQWLTEYRKVTARTTIKKYFSQSDFEYWIKYGAIPYIDLLLMTKVEGKKITDNKLSKLIFPNEYDVDIVGRLRDTTKKIASTLMRHETLCALQLQNHRSDIG